jgi:hypothetical protein
LINIGKIAFGGGVTSGKKDIIWQLENLSEGPKKKEDLVSLT